MPTPREILDDLNAVLDGDPRPADFFSVDESADWGDEWTNETTAMLFAAVMDAESLAEHDEETVESLLNDLLGLALDEEAKVIWTDPEHPSKGSVSASGAVGVKEAITHEIGKIMMHSPPPMVKAAGTIGMELWGGAIGKAMNSGQILTIRVKKDGTQIIEPNFGKAIHWYKKMLNDIGLDLTKGGERRMVDQIEDQIIDAAKTLGKMKGKVSKKAKSKAGRLLGSTKKRTSYKGRKTRGAA